MEERILSDEGKVRELCAILAMGCSREAAARYIGCPPSAIAREAQTNSEFAVQLTQAEQRAELAFMRNIRNAAEKAQYWRAAAWALERCRPERYAARGADTLTTTQVLELLTRLAEIIVAEIPVEQYRKAVLRRFESLAVDLETSWNKRGGRRRVIRESESDEEKENES